jgi:hypothetical protein
MCYVKQKQSRMQISCLIFTQVILNSTVNMSNCINNGITALIPDARVKGDVIYSKHTKNI